MTQNRKGRITPARAATAHKKASQPKPVAVAKSSRDKVRAHRKRLRDRGMRLVQIWLPDMRSKTFAEQAHRDSLAIARSTREADDQAWVDAMSWWNSPEAAALEKREPSMPWWRDDNSSK
jgi:hypothetical protein